MNDKILEGFKEDTRRQKPGLSDKALEKIVQKVCTSVAVRANLTDFCVPQERAFLLPGGGKKGKDKSAPEMVRKITKALDVNGDGKLFLFPFVFATRLTSLHMIDAGDVTKAEFKMQWSAFAKQTFKKTPTKATNSMTCTVQ